jgi:hypothetical protein
LDMSETLDSVRRESIASAAMAVASMPNQAAWTAIPAALSALPPADQHRLRPIVWRVRAALMAHVRANPGLSEGQLREAATEIAATILSGDA